MTEARVELQTTLAEVVESRLAQWRANEHRRQAILDDTLRLMVWKMDAAFVQRHPDPAEAWRIIRRAAYDEQIRKLGLSRQWYVEAGGARRTRWSGLARVMEVEHLEVLACGDCRAEVTYWPSEPRDILHVDGCPATLTLLKEPA